MGTLDDDGVGSTNAFVRRSGSVCMAAWSGGALYFQDARLVWYG